MVVDHRRLLKSLDAIIVVQPVQYYFVDSIVMPLNPVKLYDHRPFVPNDSQYQQKHCIEKSVDVKLNHKVFYFPMKIESFNFVTWVPMNCVVAQPLQHHFPVLIGILPTHNLLSDFSLVDRVSVDQTLQFPYRMPFF